jgi:hypothetical protein
MARRHYQVVEIEALIPELETAFARILQLRVGMRGFEKKLEAAGVDIEIDDGAGGVSVEAVDSGEPDEVKTARAMFRGYYEALSESLDRIRMLGGDVKDLDLGLVDFPGRREGQDILICWRLGEKKIQFWHTPDEGFAGRRPIDADMMLASSRLD